MSEKIKVLIVDDSAVFRQSLSKLLLTDPSIEILATAADPYIAASKMAMQVPDVITLDIEMPRMDGLTFLKKIMSQHPLPVVVISGMGDDKKGTAIRALEFGAVEALSKEMFVNGQLNDETTAQICSVIKSAAQARLTRRPATDLHMPKVKLSADVVLQRHPPKNLVHTHDKIIAIGASTGGTEAIRKVLEALPENSPGVVIVQHMPENFTRSFANRLNDLCTISVKEAQNGDLVKPGTALIAPGNHHMMLKKRGAQYYVETNQAPLVNRHRPAVDVLFRSVALYAGQNSIGVILTGMGNDGAKGLLEMKEAGAKTIAQDEKSSVVFGMPKEAILLNAADKVLPVGDIAPYMLKHISSRGLL